MKFLSSLCIVAVYLCVWLSTSGAQSVLSCAPNSQVGSDFTKLSSLLQQAPSDECRIQLVELVKVADDFVNNSAKVLRALSVICEPVCLEYVRNFAEQCQPSYVQLLALACGKNGQQNFCYATVAMNNGTGVLIQCFPERFQPMPPAEVVTTEPSTNTTATSPPFICTNECRTALESFRAFHGCCISNAFNSTTFGLQQFGLADNALYGACGVDTVSGYCPEPFVTTTTTLATDSSLGFAAYGMLTLLGVLTTFLV